MPHMSCATANARLIDAMPRPVALLSGLMNSACDWRTPNTSANTTPAAAMIHSCLRSNCIQHPLDQLMQSGEAPGAGPRAHAGLRLLPQRPRGPQGLLAFLRHHDGLAARVGPAGDLDEAGVRERPQVARQGGAVGEELLREIAHAWRAVSRHRALPASLRRPPPPDAQPAAARGRRPRQG